MFNPIILRKTLLHGLVFFVSAAIGVDASGRLLRVFTVNHWVVGDVWLPAEATIALLPRFDLQLARPSYLVNLWLTAIFVAYEAEIGTNSAAGRDNRCLAQ